MKTITFYSYKGGVGRTLALANMAEHLSRLNQKVCIIDFDLEAPGLQYKFLKADNIQKIEAGLVDYICFFIKNKKIPGSLKEYSLIIPRLANSKGEIRLIPTGNILSPNYWKDLSSINWRNLLYNKFGQGIPFFLELQERIEIEFKPDVLLIDSRAGISDMSGICTSLLPDKVVFLVTNNRENIEGTRQILRSIQKSPRFSNQEPIKFIFALTRIPFPESKSDKDLENKMVTELEIFFNEPITDLESQVNVNDMCVLHSDRELELSETLRINAEDKVDDTVLLRDYLKLFAKITDDVMGKV